MKNTLQKKLAEYIGLLIYQFSILIKYNIMFKNKYINKSSNKFRQNLYLILKCILCL